MDRLVVRIAVIGVRLIGNDGLTGRLSAGAYDFLVLHELMPSFITQ